MTTEPTIAENQTTTPSTDASGATDGALLQLAASQLPNPYLDRAFDVIGWERDEDGRGIRLDDDHVHPLEFPAFIASLEEAIASPLGVSEVTFRHQFEDGPGSAIKGVALSVLFEAPGMSPSQLHAHGESRAAAVIGMAVALDSRGIAPGADTPTAPEPASEPAREAADEDQPAGEPVSGAGDGESGDDAEQPPAAAASSEPASDGEAGEASADADPQPAA